MTSNQKHCRPKGMDNIINVLKEENHQLRIIYPVKLLFKNKSKNFPKSV